MAVVTNDMGHSDSTTASARPESHTDANTMLFGLPPEVLQVTCEYLASCEPTKKSLRAFASTSKACLDITVPERFSHPQIRITDDATQLDKDVSLL
jgi:hypothetical protein